MIKNTKTPYGRYISGAGYAVNVTSEGEMVVGAHLFGLDAIPVLEATLSLMKDIKYNYDQERVRLDYDAKYDAYVVAKKDFDDAAQALRDLEHGKAADRA